MAIIYSYDQATPTLQDFLLGTDKDNENSTKQFSIGDIILLANQNIGTGTVTSVDIIGDQFITATGGPITSFGTFNIGLQAIGVPGPTTFLRGDNRWATVGESLSAEIGVFVNNVSLTTEVSTLNFIGDIITGQSSGGAVTLTFDAENLAPTITAGPGIEVLSPQANTFEISNTGIITLEAGSQIAIEENPVGSSNWLISTDGIVDSQYVAGDGLQLDFDTTTNIGTFGVEYINSNNYIAANPPLTPSELPTSTDFIHYNSVNDVTVQGLTFGEIPISSVDAIKTYIDDGDSDKVSYATDTYTSIDSVKNVVSLTDAEYQTLVTNGTTDANTLYLTVATAVTTETVTLSPFNNNIVDSSPGSGYTLTGDASGATRVGSVGSSYQFTTGVQLPNGYQFSASAPFTASNPSGSIPSGGTSVAQTLTGTIELIPAGTCTATLVISDQVTGAPSTAYTITSSNTTSSGPCPHNYGTDFAGVTSVTINDPAYTWSSGPTITDPTPNQSISGSQNVTVTVQGVLQAVTGTATLVIDDAVNGGTEGTEYVIGTNNALTQSGPVGSSFSWTTTLTPAAFYGFNDPANPLNYDPGQTQSGTYTLASQSFDLDITGTISQTANCIEYDFFGTQSADQVNYTDCSNSPQVWSYSQGASVTVCAQLGTPTITSGNPTVTATSTVCQAVPRYQNTYYTDSNWTGPSGLNNAITDCANNNVDTSSTVTVYITSTTLASGGPGTYAYTGSSGAGVFSGILTDCTNRAVEFDNTGLASSSAQITPGGMNNIQTSSMYSTESAACSQGNALAQDRYTNNTADLAVTHNIVYKSSNPFAGTSIDHADAGWYKFNSQSTGVITVEVGAGQDAGKVVTGNPCSNPILYTVSNGPSLATIAWTNAQGVVQTGKIQSGQSLDVCSTTTPLFNVGSGSSSAGVPCTGDSSVTYTYSLTNNISGTGYNLVTSPTSPVTNLGPGETLTFTTSLQLNSGCSYSGPTTFPKTITVYTGNQNASVNGGTVSGTVSCGATSYDLYICANQGITPLKSALNTVTGTSILVDDAVEYNGVCYYVLSENFVDPPDFTPSQVFNDDDDVCFECENA